MSIWIYVCIYVNIYIQIYSLVKFNLITLLHSIYFALQPMKCGHSSG